MIVKDDAWEQIRSQFTEVEKQQLRNAVAGEIICPKGFVVDPNGIDGGLFIKLKKVLAREFLKGRK